MFSDSAVDFRAGEEDFDVDHAGQFAIDSFDNERELEDSTDSNER
jgi:hypothetical protein